MVARHYGSADFGVSRRAPEEALEALLCSATDMAPDAPITTAGEHARERTGMDMTDLPANSYCLAARGHALHGPYHDNEYGFPIEGDDALFERLLLEINQAGLSWLTVLKKREGLRAAYDHFSVDRVARYGEADRSRLLADPGIVRNRLKIDAAIGNAKRLLEIRDSHGSFGAWLEAHHPRDKPAWVALFKKTFRFTGGEITGEFLKSIGFLPGAHHPRCPVYRTIERLQPPWRR